MLRFTGLLATILLLLGPVLTAARAGESSPDVKTVERWIEALADPGPAGRQAVAELKALSTEKSPPLEKAAGEFEENPARKWRARGILRFLRTAGTRYEKEMNFLLTVASWELAKDAPDFLQKEREEAGAKLEGEEATVVPVLLAAYPENDYRRYSVARDLLVKRGEEVVSPASKLLDRAEFLSRLRAVHLLALVGGEKAMQALSRASKDSNNYVRKRVLEAWSEGEAKWKAKVSEFLSDEDASIRVVAVRAFDPESGEPAALAKAATDDSYLVRKAAAEVMASSGEKGFVALLASVGAKGASPGKLETIRGLGLVARPDVKNLERNQKDREAWGHRATDAKTVLARLLLDKAWAVRAAAAEGLGLSGAPNAVRPLVSGEKHPFVRFRMREALGEGKGALPPDASLFGKKSKAEAKRGIDALVWLPAEEEALDEALTAAKLTRKDLEFDRNITKDEYRFPVVQKGLDRPMELAAIARSFAEACRDRIQGLAFYRLPGLAGLPQPEFLPPEGKAAFPGLDKAPAWLREILVPFLSDGRASEELKKAFSRLTPEDREKVLSHRSELGWDPELLPVWKKVDSKALACAAHHFQSQVSKLYSGFRKKEGELDGTGVVWSLETPLGKVTVLGKGNDRIEGDHYLIVDLGGDDTYVGRSAAGATWRGNAPGLSAVVDLGGNDTYVSADPVAQGAGYMGIGLLFDYAGNDVYRAVANSQGLGWFGAGLLYDMVGDDRYECDRVAQGVGGFGYGLLVDSGGDDVYYARAYAQGFGFVQGIGVLADSRGNDLYYVDGKYLQYETLPHRKLSMCQGVGYGMRPHASGGIGILWEGGGDDVYRGNAYAQGTSYWYAMGILVDEEGYDNYSAKIYSQASGIHMGVGVLADLQGSDNYLSWGLSQSGSHDLGVSYFLDAAGDDIYACHDASLGGAINHALALFVDRSGRDAYFMKNRMAIGSGDQPGRKDWGSIAVFLDLGGSEDTYSSQKGGNGRFWADGNFGVGIDR
ncbi:MAG: HEAT repeat domain-containing protein [Planctomycetota bacterium]|jgi:HEAT repeat protein